MKETIMRVTVDISDGGEITCTGRFYPFQDRNNKYYQAPEVNDIKRLLECAIESISKVEKQIMGDDDHE